MTIKKTIIISIITFVIAIFVIGAIFKEKDSADEIQDEIVAIDSADEKEEYIINESDATSEKALENTKTDSETINQPEDMGSEIRLIDLTPCDFLYKPNFLDEECTDNFGNKYAYGIYLDAYTYSFKDTSATYYIGNLGYTSLSGIVTPASNLNVNHVGYEMKIYVTKDGQETIAYQSEDLNKTFLPERIEVDIEGADFIRIACNQGSDIWGPMGGAYIMEPCLSR